MYTLIHFPLCPHSRAIRLALAECGLEAELKEERPWEWREEFLAVNPAGTLPVLRDDLADQAAPLCGAYAISEYLSDTAADGAGDNRAFAFFPGDERARAEVRRLADWFLGKFHHEVSAYLLEEKVERRFNRESGGPLDMAQVRAGKSNLRYHLSYIGHLTQERNWLAGESLSFADLAAAAQLSCIDYLGDVPWEHDEDAKSWYARIKSRPSFRALLSDRLPGMSPPESYADPDF